MTEIIAALPDVFSIIGTVLTEITGTPILLFFLAAGLVPVGIALFRQLKGAAQ